MANKKRLREDESRMIVEMPKGLHEDLHRLAKVWTKRDRGAIQWTLSSVVRKLAVDAVDKDREGIEEIREQEKKDES